MGGSSCDEAQIAASLPPWKPSHLAFRPYLQFTLTASKSESLSQVARIHILGRLTSNLVETFQTCNPSFKYSNGLKHKRYLTSPSTGVSNDGCDNSSSDLILTVNLELINIKTQRRYIVKDILGHGTFGQVAKCWVAELNSFVAVKIIKNHPAYYQQALVEVSILTVLNKKYDPEDRNHIIRILDNFVYQQHLCICFELLDMNLYELIKMNQFRGLPLNIVQLFSKQILHGLALLKAAGTIHCDLKPENILLCKSVKPAEIKIIDFGSACMENHTIYTYIQSRYYRSPEVLLGYQYNTAIDMWSLGCIVAELFLGLPLFPGASEFDLLRRMIKILGGQPPDYVLKDAKHTGKFFNCIGDIQTHGTASPGNSCYQALTFDEYELRNSKKPSMGKEYFNHPNLEAIVLNYPYGKNMSQDDILKENQGRLALIDFLKGLVEFDPAKRWSPKQASGHPFVTGEPFICPYKPIRECIQMETARNIHQKSRQQHSVFHKLSSSLGTIESHGYFSGGVCCGSRYGSYGDKPGTLPFYFPATSLGRGMKTKRGSSLLGSNPDTSAKFNHSYDNGIAICSSSRNLMPFPVGYNVPHFASSSKFNHLCVNSPCNHISTPASSSFSSPLGKAVSVNRNSRNQKVGVYNESYPSSDWLAHGRASDGLFHGLSVGNHSVSGNCAWGQTENGTSTKCSSAHIFNSSVNHGSFSQIRQDNGSTSYESENCLSLPSPGDWDPNYSDDLLLQEESAATNTLCNEFNDSLRIGAHGQLHAFRNSDFSSNSRDSVTTLEQHGPLKMSSAGDLNTQNFIGGYEYDASVANASRFVLSSSQVFPFHLGKPDNWQSSKYRASGSGWSDYSQHDPLNVINSNGSFCTRVSSFNNSGFLGRPISSLNTSFPRACENHKGYRRMG